MLEHPAPRRTEDCSIILLRGAGACTLADPCEVVVPHETRPKCVRHSKPAILERSPRSPKDPGVRTPRTPAGPWSLAVRTPGPPRRRTLQASEGSKWCQHRTKTERTITTSAHTVYIPKHSTYHYGSVVDVSKYSTDGFGRVSRQNDNHNNPGVWLTWFLFPLKSSTLQTAGKSSRNWHQPLASRPQLSQ